MPDNEQNEPKVTPTAPSVEEPKPMAEVLPLFQVKFKSGQGQQVAATTADEVRAQMVKTYGEEYEILSIEEIKPVEVK